MHLLRCGMHAINLLNDASLYPNDNADTMLDFAKIMLNDTDEDVQKVALEYLANSKDRALLAVLDEIGARDDSIGRNAYIATWRLKIFVDPVAALTEISSAPNAVNTEILRLLEECVTSI